MTLTRRPELYCLLTGEPTPSEKLVAEWNETAQQIRSAENNHAKVVPLRSKLKTLTHIRLVERV